MASTLVQKILARSSGRARVEPGEVIWATPDLTTMPEVSYPAYVKRLADIGIDTLARPERLVVAIDHETPAHSVAAAERNRLTRQLAAKMHVGHLFDGEGITHPLTVERGLVMPGMFVAGADTHTSGLGGVGALAMPFGIEVTMIMATGRIWLKVPQTIRVCVNGALPVGVTARDVVLHVMRLIDADEANERVIEYGGTAIERMSVPERITISGLTVDMGADAGMVPADARTLQYLRDSGVQDPQVLSGDDDADYARIIDVDARALRPLVSIPPSPAHVREATELGDVAIQHAYIGSCASGSLAELRMAAALVKGRKVRDGVQLLVIPATRRVHEQAMAEGVLGTLMAAGAQIAPSTCGPCFGGLAPLAAGEVRISTSTRNDPGRMGSLDANIYLASSLTVAASALAGHIADPRDFLQEALT
ncbi:aconitase/3-isopropylmalate dehydratase large subunit family protein [Paraburkholderia phymatum]|uniref:3-isopropylmalate dehydratase large subunit n=1 Tax=Paraburkholderia phymatum TaxID=148447 RepID=UPI0031731B41